MMSPQVLAAGLIAPFSVRLMPMLPSGIIESMSNISLWSGSEG